MRNRDYKSIAPGAFMHIYNRGNNRERIFFDETDYKAFLFRLGLGLGIELETLKNDTLLAIPSSRIRINANKNLFNLHSFCLMPNHFHLLIEQIGEVPISKLISQVCTSYSMYINKKHKRVGHVFQERFKLVLIENNPQLMWTSSYIHMNPVKDGLVKHPQDYKWSSYPDHIGKRKLPILYIKFLASIFGERNFEIETLNWSKKD